MGIFEAFEKDQVAEKIGQINCLEKNFRSELRKAFGQYADGLTASEMSAIIPEPPRKTAADRHWATAAVKIKYKDVPFGVLKLSRYTRGGKDRVSAFGLEIK